MYIPIFIFKTFSNILFSLCIILLLEHLYINYDVSVVYFVILYPYYIVSQSMALLYYYTAGALRQSRFSYGDSGLMLFACTYT